ncbi:carbohydrate ABC transporter permease [Desmospora activa]|uniref:Carbohydrate ABC transporter membrane protein 1 (CUT1 family) n=1 Tax=Desmospora activa DSM 45169 TaxID=1121389 RepID=A0A2T4ZC20_9BACL|nr:sugar ABC transporter permease [Desmospora activa]PTM59419.1 carbohydrate ABC transporter membrane protein 1 (CUT1 family) [Desmospora activa DSM 45169]
MESHTPIMTRKTSLKRRKGSLQRKETMAGWLFVAPMLTGVSVLTLLPIVATLILGFSEWNFVAGIEGLTWVGFNNFQRLIQDPSFVTALFNNLIFLLAIPIYMVIALVLAILIDRYVYGKAFFKVAFFMPYISSVVAVAVVWQVLFHPSAGPINQFLLALGIQNPPKWIADPAFALPSIMLIYIWISIGFNMVVYIAGLQTIPKDLYEAAEIDGANAWVKFRQITVPLLSRASFFLLITGIISTFKVFDLIAILTQGGPIQSTSVLVWYLYETAFVNLEIGYASAIAMILFSCVLGVTLLQWVIQKKWVID